MNNNYDYQRHGFLNAWEAVFLIKLLQVVVVLYVEGRGAHVTCLVAALQPTLALVGGAVGEGLRRGTALFSFYHYFLHIFLLRM